MIVIVAASHPFEGSLSLHLFERIDGEAQRARCGEGPEGKDESDENEEESSVDLSFESTCAAFLSVHSTLTRAWLIIELEGVQPTNPHKD